MPDATSGTPRVRRLGPDANADLRQQPLVQMGPIRVTHLNAFPREVGSVVSKGMPDCVGEVMTGLASGELAVKEIADAIFEVSLKFPC